MQIPKRSARAADKPKAGVKAVVKDIKKLAAEKKAVPTPATAAAPVKKGKPLWPYDKDGNPVVPPAADQPADKLADRAAKVAKTASKVSTKKEYEYPEGFKKPKSLALGTDTLWELQVKRKAVQKIADALEVQENAIKHYLIENLPKSDASGVAGKFCRVTVGSKEVPHADDWSKVYAGIVADYLAHVKKKDGQQDGAFSLLQRRLGEAAIQEIWKAGESVEGVGVFNAVTLSINKI